MATGARCHVPAAGADVAHRPVPTGCQQGTPGGTTANTEGWSSMGTARDALAPGRRHDPLLFLFPKPLPGDRAEPPPSPRPGPAAPTPQPPGQLPPQSGAGPGRTGGQRPLRGLCPPAPAPRSPRPRPPPEARAPGPVTCGRAARGAGARSRPRGAGAAPHRGAAGGPRPARTGCNSGGGGAAGGRRRLRPQPRRGGAAPTPRPSGQARRGGRSARTHLRRGTLPRSRCCSAGRPPPRRLPPPGCRRGQADTRPRPTVVPSPGPGGRSGAVRERPPCPEQRRGSGARRRVPPAAPARPQRSPPHAQRGLAPGHGDRHRHPPLLAPVPRQPQGRVPWALRRGSEPARVPKAAERPQDGDGRCLPPPAMPKGRKLALQTAMQAAHLQRCNPSLPARGETTHSCISAPTAFGGRLITALARIRVRGTSRAVRRTAR
ncbi:translation initiation factor IF-2-like [Vidua chalybeata]|uniref:translation initiation factor IF-2-like n=1 Tax=Vidua chalybeata TaxID=81927 RepID=UPI0023A90C10|nr:translation initiation factor IF-2-like [Vidua chalybeata]